MNAWREEMDLIESIGAQFPSFTNKQLVCFFGAVLVTALFLWYAIMKKKISVRQGVCALAAFVYLYIVYMSTVYGRKGYEQRYYELVPFWSYIYTWTHKSKEMALEILLNVFLLVPAGIAGLVGMKERRHGKWVVLGAFLISASIELQQLIFKKGWFEWDDMIHNTLGVLICSILWEHLQTKHKNR